MEQKKGSPRNLTHRLFYIGNRFNFFHPLWGIVPFYIRNPFKIHLEQKKKFTKKIELIFNFAKENSLNFKKSSHKN